jgi:hypothetical protein
MALNFLGKKVDGRGYFGKDSENDCELQKVPWKE